jgi:hypothetical protein
MGRGNDDSTFIAKDLERQDLERERLLIRSIETKEAEAEITEESLEADINMTQSEDLLEEEERRKAKEEEEMIKLRKEEERRARDAKVARDQQRDNVRRALEGYGIEHFSKGSVASEALDDASYLLSSYREEIIEIDDQFLRQEGQTHIWRLYDESYPYRSKLIAKGSSASKEEAKRMTKASAQATIGKKVLDLQKTIAEEEEKRRRGSDLEGLNTRPLISSGIDFEDLYNLQRTSLPGGYDIVSYQIDKTVLDEDGYRQKALPWQRGWFSGQQRRARRRGLLIFHNGDLLPLADYRQSGGSLRTSSPTLVDSLGIERFLPGLTHKRAVQTGQEMIREHIISNAGKEEKQNHPSDPWGM